MFHGSVPAPLRQLIYEYAGTWRDTDRDRLVVLSGNHRIMAARDAGLTEVDVMVIDQPLTRQQRIAIQLSHNAIAGEDDPATLNLPAEAAATLAEAYLSGGAGGS